MAIPYDNQTNITKSKEVKQKIQPISVLGYVQRNAEKSTKNTGSFSQNSVDKPKSIMYNDSKESSTYSLGEVPGELLSNSWKRKNKDSMRYTGDSAKKSIDAGLKQAPDFVKDADKGTNFEKIQNASVKWKLANDSNNEELAKKATMEIIGHLSRENKEPYLKHTEPLQKYIDAKDEFDYKHKNYTTTEFLDTTPDEKVREVQQRLNELGYTDKFGEKLKEDGVIGAKTRYAKDKYEAESKQKFASIPNPDYEEYDPLDYEVLMLDENGNPIKGEKFVYAGDPLDFLAQDALLNNTFVSKNKIYNLDQKANPSNTYTHESGIKKWHKLLDVSERIPKEYRLFKEGKITKEIYTAMDTLSQRWYYADTPDAREEISRLAQSVRDNNYKVKDCTEEANKQLRDNRRFILDSMLDSIDDHQMFTVVDYGVLGYKWYEKVENQGIWDYKSKGAEWIPKQKYFLYHGQIINDNDFGNINYGYTGTILGLNPETLYKAGGKRAINPTKYEINHYYSDSEVDHYWIKKGIEQANQIGYYGNVTLPVELLFEILD